MTVTVYQSSSPAQKCRKKVRLTMALIRLLPNTILSRRRIVSAYFTIGCRTRSSRVCQAMNQQSEPH